MTRGRVGPETIAASTWSPGRLAWREMAPRTEPAESSRRSLLAKAGLIAGGVGAVMLHGSEQALARSLRETMRITPPPDQAALKIVPSGAVPQSVSVGGAINLDNTLSRGAGLVLFSNHGNTAL